MKNIKTHLTEPPLPWKRGPFIGGAGLFACGWTDDNKIFMLFSDYYIIGNPITGEREKLIEDEDLLERLSEDNLEFDLKEVKQIIRVFGLRGGNGIQSTKDRWSLTEIEQDSQERIFGISHYKQLEHSDHVFWKNYNLIKLEKLELGQWCGFAPNEKSFGIFGSGGVEIFNRE